MVARELADDVRRILSRSPRKLDGIGWKFGGGRFVMKGGKNGPRFDFAGGGQLRDRKVADGPAIGMGIDEGDGAVGGAEVYADDVAGGGGIRMCGRGRHGSAIVCAGGREGI